ncbi:transcriptional regulator [Erwinia sp. S38]|uniref:helix-turn-helix transcriptional regulator n=1 Tax=Erwinia sp. S38 TaxID=2769338 RepID=UPI001909C159|nr:PAS domain-containing protein [Erwinia sp. S38]MBK0002985.1 PAS domain-containing protein [Erwinia sp. S38]
MTASTDKSLLIGQLSAVMDAFASVAGRHIEVVLHDLAQPETSVIKIINGHVSGRKPGSPLLDAPDNDRGFLGLLNPSAAPLDREPTVFNRYPTTSLQGKPLQSSTVFFKDENGKPQLSLCFNADNSAINAAREALAILLPQEAEEKQEQDIGLEEKLDEIIRACISPTGQLRTGATKQEKVEIVRQMQNRGMFMVRGGVEKAAKVLGVTRYTIYNYLDQIKKEAGPTTLPTAKPAE